MTVIYLFIPIVVTLLVVIRTYKRKEELPLYILIISSTLPFISDGYLLAYGSKGFAIRVEYILFLYSIFLMITKGKPSPIKYHSYIKAPIIFLFFIYFQSLIISNYWDNTVTFGMAFKLLVIVPYFFIFYKICKRENLEKLLYYFLWIGVTVTIILTVAAFSDTLYSIVFEIQDSGSYIYRYNNSNIQRVWARYADQLIPFLGSIVFIYFLLDKKNRFIYLFILFLLMTRAVTSGFRLVIFSLLLSFILSFYFLNKYNYFKKNRIKIFITLIITIISISLLITKVPELNNRYNLFLDRTLKLAEYEFEDERQYMGTLLVFNLLNDSGANAWIFGMGGLRYAELGYQKGDENQYDINTPILAVYRFGLIGLFTLLFLIYRALKTSFILLKLKLTNIHEISIIIALVNYLLISLLITPFRGFDLSENFKYLSCFIIFLSWLEVIYRDIQLQNLKLINVKK